MKKITVKYLLIKRNRNMYKGVLVRIHQQEKKERREKIIVIIIIDKKKQKKKQN